MVKPFQVLLVAALATAAACAHGQGRMYRCGSTLTNSEQEAQAKGCTPLGGTSRVIDGQRHEAQDVLNIPRAGDGHFYVDGSINGYAVRFIVDTGATSVAVADEVAQAAGMVAGSSVMVNTAAGVQPARLTMGTVRVGPLSAPDVLVSTGVRMRGLALLGQSFLERYDVRMAGDLMTIKPR